MLNRMTCKVHTAPVVVRRTAPEKAGTSYVCSELEAFVFVFEAANRMVLEKPKYNHATYFFEIEEPLPISCQVTFWNQVLALSGNSFWHQRQRLSACHHHM